MDRPGDGKRPMPENDEPNTSLRKRLKVGGGLEGDHDPIQPICQNTEGLETKNLIDPNLVGRVQQFKESQGSKPDLFVRPSSRPLRKKTLCNQCQLIFQAVFMVSSDLKPLSAQSQLPTKATRISLYQSSKQRLTFHGLKGLQLSAKNCSMCSLAWLILHKNNNAFVELAKRYSDSKFNPIPLYHEDGGTDIEELAGLKKRVWISLNFSLLFGSLSSPSTNLLVEFDMSYRTGVKHYTMYSYAPTTHLREELLVITDLENEYTAELGIPIDSRLELEGKFALMRQWLSKTTVASDVFSLRSFVPTRLLHITKDGRLSVVYTDADQIKLKSAREEGEEEEQRVRQYVALSHRWGSCQHFTSTAATIDRMVCGFSVDELPATFRDAVHVVTLLGFSYLWIDALCILQDDKEDWERESKTMGDVFGHARFTIAVHCASDDSEGFLAKSTAKRPTVDVKCSKDTTFRICRPANLEADVTNSQLGKRGWVLQERFMASETIHFTEGQIYFETTGDTVCEDGHLDVLTSNFTSVYPTGVDRPRLFSPSAAPRLREFFGLNTDSNGRPTDVHRKQVGTPLEWLDLVEMYSNCELTQESDKLMAIAGMAQKIYLKTETAYCAGIWRDRLSQGLLWLPEMTPLSPPACPRAPSWSWAAYDGPIQFPDDTRMADFTSTCELLAVNGVNMKTDPGKIAWLNGLGSLELRTKVIDLTCAHVSWKITELGPGPPRTGPLTESTDLPRIRLKTFVRVRELSHRQGELPFGWIAFDEEGNLFDPKAIVTSANLPGLCFASIGFLGSKISTESDPRLPRLPRLNISRRHEAREQLKGLNLGVFLVETQQGKNEYKRVGFGQVSDRFIELWLSALSYKTSLVLQREIKIV